MTAKLSHSLSHKISSNVTQAAFWYLQLVVIFTLFPLENYGDPDRIRTCDLQIRNLSLYPTELRGLRYSCNAMRVEIGSLIPRQEYDIIREFKHVARCERFPLMAFEVKMFPADHRRAGDCSRRRKYRRSGHALCRCR